MTSLEMLYPPVVFIDEGSAVRPVGAATPSAHRHQQPPYEFDWDAFTIVTWVLSIRDVLGSPSSWSVAPVMQFAQESVMDTGPTFSQWRERRWYQPDSAMAFAEGAGFGTINAAGTYQRTARYFPRSMRIDISSLTMAGGTDPRLRMSLVAYPK